MDRACFFRDRSICTALLTHDILHHLKVMQVSCSLSIGFQISNVDSGYYSQYSIDKRFDLSHLHCHHRVRNWSLFSEVDNTRFQLQFFATVG